MSGWALVLGASRGTGGACARALAADPGLNIFGVHRGTHAADAAAVVAEIRAQGREAHFETLDAARPEQIGGATARLGELVAAGELRVVVHAIANASVGVFTGPETYADWQYEKTFAAMAHSYVWWAKALLDTPLLAHGARLVGFTNPLTTTPLHRCGLIAAAKGALEVYVRYLALETKGRLKTSLVNFAAADTRAANVAVGDFDQRRAAFERATPEGRLVTVDEVGRLVSFIAGDGGAWFNGATIDFTGGEPWGYRVLATD